ncbi:hypothetical protein ASD42_28020 [Nocardia sp. Root136]|nr:hypothetical protein ASD42_28020 [Nocardia sp. Root136]
MSDRDAEPTAEASQQARQRIEQRPAHGRQLIEFGLGRGPTDVGFALAQQIVGPGHIRAGGLQWIETAAGTVAFEVFDGVGQMRDTTDVPTDLLESGNVFRATGQRGGMPEEGGGTELSRPGEFVERGRTRMTRTPLRTEGRSAGLQRGLGGDRVQHRPHIEPDQVCLLLGSYRPDVRHPAHRTTGDSGRITVVDVIANLGRTQQQ